MPGILIVDDHAGFRREARALLEAEGLDVVGEAADGAAAVRALSEVGADVVLLDIGLPDVDGFVVAEQLAGQPFPPRVILVSSRDAATYGERLERSRAHGFIQKDELSAAVLVELLGRHD
jgi:two-component system nitrate/nitrite response regulator NarL